MFSMYLVGLCISRFSSNCIAHLNICPCIHYRYLKPLHPAERFGHVTSKPWHSLACRTHYHRRIFFGPKSDLEKKTPVMTSDEKYTKDSGNKRRLFIKDTRIGWKAVRTDPNRQAVRIDPNQHLALGVTKHDYLESLGSKLSDRAKSVPDNLLDSWGPHQ